MNQKIAEAEEDSSLTIDSVKEREPPKMKRIGGGFIPPVAGAGGNTRAMVKRTSSNGLDSEKSSIAYGRSLSAKRAMTAESEHRKF